MTTGGGRYRVVIADDEPVARRGVRQLLAAFPTFVVAAECRDGHEVVATLAKEAADLLFLDVQMPELDGFGALAQLPPERRPCVVLLTAHEQFAVKAFEASALDYLVKPTSVERFQETMRRVVRTLESRARAREEPVVTVPTARGLRRLRISEIDWLEAADNYTRVWSGGRGQLVREPLGALDERLTAYGFVRAHRQAIVRVGAVRSVERNPGGELWLTLRTGMRVPVSRRRRALVLSAFRMAG